MALKGVTRASLMQVRVLDLEKSLQFYRDILGLVEVCRTTDGRICLKGYDEFDHHTFVIREADKPGLDFLAFKADSDQTLTEIEANTKKFEFPCEVIPANSDQPGYGRRVSVKVPTGHRIDIFAEVEMSKQHPDVKNPEIWPNGIPPIGVGACAFDHALLFGPNASETVRYFKEVLGLGVAEVAKTPDGQGDLCTWLTGSNRPHDVAVLEFAHPGKVHHYAFKLNSWTDVGRAADILTINNVVIDAGPMRHGITRGYTLYFFDPSGNRCELFAGGYAYYPDMPVRVWDFDQVGKGIFYYDRKLKDNYLEVVT